MEFPDEEVAGGSGGYAETVVEEKKSGIDPIIRVFGGDFVPPLAKIRAVFVNKREAVKPDNCRLRNLKCVLAPA